MRLLCLFVLLLGIAPNPRALAQTISVGMSVSEKTGGVFESRFASAFRSLGDVTVVSIIEPADFRLRVVVLCLPDDCGDPTTYSVSVSFAQTIEQWDVTWAYIQAKRAASDTAYPDLRYMRAIGEQLRTDRYEQHVTSWVASWGRNRYEQAIRELVAEIDARCLEKHRMMERAAQHNPDTHEWKAAWAAIDQKEWLC